MLETLSEIHSCISLIEQAAGLQFNLPTEVGDLAFQLRNMGGELVFVERLGDSIGQPVNPGLLNEARWYTAEAWISLQRMILMGWLPIEQSSAVFWLAMQPPENRVRPGKHQKYLPFIGLMPLMSCCWRVFAARSFAALNADLGKIRLMHNQCPGMQEVVEVVQAYHGKELQSSSDLKTSACCDADSVPEW